MRTIIAWKLYDTEASEVIHKWGEVRNDADEITEPGATLYRTKKGAWWLITSVSKRERGLRRRETPTGAIDEDREAMALTDADALSLMERHAAPVSHMLRYFAEQIEEA
jgi:hypothetical protein